MGHRLSATVTLIALSLSTLLNAGGILLYEIGSNDVGFASAGWSARADEPSTAFTNPAGMSRFGCAQGQLGAQPIYANLKFDPNSDTTVSGKKGDASTWLPAGGAFYVQPLNDDFACGVSVIGYFGSRLHFNKQWVGRYYLTKAVLQGFSIVPTLSYKITDCLSIGVGLNAMYGIFEQKSSVNNVLDGLPDGSFRLKDQDWGFGAVVGALYELSPCTRFGVQYISRVHLKFKDKPHFNNLGPTLATALGDLGLLESEVKLHVNVPQTVMVSAYHDLNPCIAIMGNIGWQQWSRYQKATITLASPTNRSYTTVPKYQDTWHAALGTRYRYTECLSLLGGVAFDSEAVTNKDRTLDFPICGQWRFGTGVQWQYDCLTNIGLCYEFQWQGNIHVDQNRGALAGHVSGKYANTYAHFINLGIIRTF